jgi:hypothetical protein
VQPPSSCIPWLPFRRLSWPSSPCACRSSFLSVLLSRLFLHCFQPLHYLLHLHNVAIRLHDAIWSSPYNFSVFSIVTTAEESDTIRAANLTPKCHVYGGYARLIRRVLVRMIGFISTLVTHSLLTWFKYRPYSAISHLHHLRFTVANALRFPVSTSRLLATDLSHKLPQSHTPNITHKCLLFTSKFFTVRPPVLFSRYYSLFTNSPTHSLSLTSLYFT